MSDDPAIPAVQFDSTELEPDDRFEAWREAIAPVFDVEPLEHTNAAGRASNIEAFSLGDMLAANVNTHAQRFHHARPNHRMDHLLVQVHRQGGYQGRLDDRTVQVAPHHVSLIDLDRPLHTVSADTDILNVMLPRDLFHHHPTFLDGMHGLVLPPSRGTFLADYLAALMRRLPDVKAREAPELTRITRDMVLACCAEDTDARVRAEPAINATIRRRLEDLIEQELTSPRLTPDALCRLARLSRTQLYRHFERDGGVARYIQRRRLARVKRHLDDPREYRSIGKLAEAHGFRSLAHFSRCFVERYHYSPSDARAFARAQTTPGTTDAGRTISHWVRWLKRH